MLLRRSDTEDPREMLIRKKALTIVCLLALKVLFTRVDEKKRFVVDLVDADENNIW